MNKIFQFNRMIQKYLSNHKIVSLIQNNNCNKKVDNYKPYFGVFQMIEKLCSNRNFNAT